MPRLLDTYNSVVRDQLTSQFGFKNIERVPKIAKIVINVGAGNMQSDKSLIESLQSDITKISGQKPITTKAKKAIAAFKLREGNTVGMVVTLRGVRMYDFLDKLINITIPRIRDFRGLSQKGFDGHGNYTFGLKEQSMFIEIPYETLSKIHGLQVTIATTAKTNEEGKALLVAFGFPFSKEEV